MKTSTVVVIVAVLVVVIGGAVLLYGRNSGNNYATPSSSAYPSANASPSASSSAASQSPSASAATVTYSASGFSPAQTTVKSGESVTFKNTSSKLIQVDSDPHPVHTDDTDLNVGDVAPGQSVTVTLTKKGSFGFHNHLDSSDTAKITIQ